MSLQIVRHKPLKPIILHHGNFKWASPVLVILKTKRIKKYIYNCINNDGKYSFIAEVIKSLFCQTAKLFQHTRPTSIISSFSG